MKTIAQSSRQVALFGTRRAGAFQNRRTRGGRLHQNVGAGGWESVGAPVFDAVSAGRLSCHSRRSGNPEPFLWADTLMATGKRQAWASPGHRSVLKRQKWLWNPAAARIGEGLVTTGILWPTTSTGVTRRHICDISTYMQQSDQASDRAAVGGRMPKNFLTPWILLLLKQWHLHGYLLLQYVRNMGFFGVDPATLYKELRNLEKEGFVSSEWQTDGSGPAKRIYSLTEAGEEMLRGWADVVAGYQKMITGFFDLYAEAVGTNPRDVEGAGESESTTKSPD